jgi:ubiquinone biosynthesis accessory factor UbiK
MLFSELSKQLFSELRQALPGQVTDLPEQELRVLLESLLRKLNLVSREEFDAQQAVLMRTREKVEALEQALAEVQATLDQSQDQNQS